MNLDITIIKNTCETVSVELIEEIKRRKQEGKVVGIGIYSDEYFLETYGREPLRCYDEREKLTKSIKDVAFVIKITSDTDEPVVSLEEVKLEEPSVHKDTIKKYHIAYAPGTYDLFHTGHLEHLMEVRDLCDILVVGVNSDDLVYSNKKKKTKLSQEDRMKVVRNLKFVDYVYLVETNNKQVANTWVKNEIGSPISAIFLGTDLQNQNFDDAEGIPILFTERDPELMKKRCSSYYREQLEKLNKECS